MGGITIFAVPKAFHGHFGLIQRNALRSWAAMDPRPEIILLGTDHGTAEAAREIGAVHIGDLECNKEGTPLLPDVFKKAEERAFGRVLVYVNADILLPPFFARKLEEIHFKKFLVIGRRWDLDVTEPLDAGQAGWWDASLERAQAEGELHAETGMDYFAYSRGLWGPIPPFAIGRTVWDNWLMYRACARGAVVVDGTEVLPVIHQNHDYSHAPGGPDVVLNGPEAVRNRELAAKDGMDDYDVYFSVRDANRLWRARGMIRARGEEYRRRRREVMRALHPGRYRLYAFMKAPAGPMRRRLRALLRLAANAAGLRQWS